MPKTRWDRPGFHHKSPKTKMIYLQVVLKSLPQEMGCYIQEDLYTRGVLAPLRKFRDIISLAFTASQEFTDSKNEKEYKVFLVIILSSFQFHGSLELSKISICLPSLTCMMFRNQVQMKRWPGVYIHSLITKEGN